MANHYHSNWLITVKLPVPSDIIMPKMRNLGIDTRRMFYPLSEMPPYKASWQPDDLSASKKLSDYGLSLPSYPQLLDYQVDYICDKLKVVCKIK